MRALHELYSINNQILECIDEETGEIIDYEKLQQLGMKKETIIEQLAKMYKNETYFNACCEKEIDELRYKKEMSQKKMENIKKVLWDELNGQNFKTASVKISYRKSTEVKVDDINQLDDDYLRYKEPEPDKKKIRESLNRGIHLNGVRLIEKQNIQIK